jgi:thiamine-phosphate pyrophosphorylase
MKRRQTRTPQRWLVADERTGGELPAALRRLPPGSGVLLLYRDMAAGKRARLLAMLRRLARRRGLVIVDEAAGEAARVHILEELLNAGLGRVPLLFLSPMAPTRSHPGRPPLPRMKAAALLRLAKVPVIALGGMNEQRFAAVRRLGFAGWAGIDAWRLSSLKSRGQAPKSRR